MGTDLIEQVEKLRGYLLKKESQDLLAEVILELRRGEVYATYFWKFCPDIDAYVDAYPHLFPEIDDD